ALDPLVTESRCQKLDHGLSPALSPPPDLPVMNAEYGLELQRLENLARSLFHTIPERDRKTLEAGDIQVSRLCQFLGIEAHTQFPLVEGIGAGSYQGPSEPEHTRPGEGKKHGPAVSVGCDKAFGTQGSRQACHRLPAFLCVGPELSRPGKVRAHLGRVLTQIAALH